MEKDDRRWFYHVRWYRPDLVLAEPEPLEEPPPGPPTGPNYGPPFWRHPNPGMRCAAKVGGCVGTAAGLPIAIALLPLWAELSNLGPLVPLWYCAGGVATVGGGAVWPLFGWWPREDETVASAAAAW